MEIRTATKEDLPRIMELGRAYGHLMLYQKSREMVEQYLDRILVAGEDVSGAPVGYEPDMKVVGYYHYIVSGDPGFEEMLRCYRQFPEELVEDAVYGTQMEGVTRVLSDIPRGKGELCVIMQGACHRDVARLFYDYLMDRYPEIWVYCSIKSHKPDTYKELGFSFNPEEQFSFFNVSKGDKSTYQLGRWKR